MRIRVKREAKRDEIMWVVWSGLEKASSIWSEEFYSQQR